MTTRDMTPFRAQAAAAYEQEGRAPENLEQTRLLHQLETTFSPEIVDRMTFASMGGRLVACIDDVRLALRVPPKPLYLFAPQPDALVQGDCLCVVLVCDCGDVVESSLDIVTLADVGDVLINGLWEVHTCAPQTRCKIVTAQLRELDAAINTWLDDQGETLFVRSITVTALNALQAVATILYRD